LLGFSFILLRFGCGGETTTGRTLTLGAVEIGRGRERREVQVFALLDVLILVGGGGGKGVVGRPMELRMWAVQ